MRNRVLSKLRKNPLFNAGLIWIFITLCIVLGGAVIRPDSSPYANEQHLELMNLKPGASVQFLEIPERNGIQRKTSIGDFFVGYSNHTQSTPFDSILLSGDELLVYGFGTSLPKAIPLSEIIPNIENNDLTLNYILENFVQQRTFILGTDKYGRDLLSRLMSGAYISLSVGAISVFISLLVGITMGTIAGYFKGWVDQLIMWIINVVWSVPTLLLVIAITLVLGKGYWQIFIAVGLTMWVEVARVIRGQVLSVREKEYVEAGEVLGYSNFRIITRHILPNVLSPVIVISAANFATAILLEAGLSFLGIGVPPPQASWGKMISEHKAYLITGEAHLAIIPGVAIMLLVLSFTFIGNGFRDAFDERID